MGDQNSFAIGVEKGTKKGVYTVCFAVHGWAVYLAPVDSGDLKKSLSIAVFGNTKGTSDLMQPTDKYTGKVGSTQAHAPAVEFGRPDMPNYPMQPYLRPAAMGVRAKLNATFTPELKKELEDICKKRRAASIARNARRNK